MHELRKDPILDRWVAVLSDSRPPGEYVQPPEQYTENTCRLCSGRESETPPEITAVRDPNTRPNTPGWWARVIPHFNPILQIEGELGRKGIGMYDKMNSIGADELVIEAPEHHMRPDNMGLEQMVRVLTLYRNRLADLEKDPRMRYVLLYKNSGKGAGAMMAHPHSEIIATPIIPQRIKEELEGAKSYYAYKERCIYCDIMREELRMGSRVIIETKYFLVFCPYAPRFSFEFWIIPRRHSCIFHDINKEETSDLALLLGTMIKKMRVLFNEPQYNYVVHTAPNMIPRRDHWHTLGDDFHWHIEVMPRLGNKSGFERGSGFYVLTTSPEDAARYLKEA